MGVLKLLTMDEPEITSNVSNNTHFKGTLLKTPKPLISGAKLGSFASSSVAPTLGSYALPATIAIGLLQPAIDSIKEAYEDKMKKLGLGSYAPIDSNKAPITSESTPYTPPDAVIPIPDSVPPTGDTLLTVLKGSSNSIEGVARSILYSNELVVKSINDLAQIVSSSHDVNIAYRDIELSNSLLTNDYLLTVAQSLKHLSDLSLADSETTQAYRDENLSNFLDLTTAVEDLSTKISSGIKVDKSDLENSLISKKIAHIDYETTPIQLDNLGDTIPEATPQHMRAIKDAVIAKKNSDENTLEIDDDIDDIFTMPSLDWDSLFAFSKKSTRNQEIQDSVNSL